MLRNTEAMAPSPAAGIKVQKMGDDRLFSGLKFLLARDVPQRSHFLSKIEKHGGVVVAQEEPNTIVIVDHAKKKKVQTRSALSFNFIDACIRASTLLGKEDYQIESTPVRPAGDTNIGRRSGKAPFTKQEDCWLWDQVSEHIRQGGTGKGKRLFEQLEALQPRHSWQSWRDHWIKVLAGRPRPLPLTASQLEQHGVTEPDNDATTAPSEKSTTPSQIEHKDRPRANVKSKRPRTVRLLIEDHDAERDAEPKKVLTPKEDLNVAPASQNDAPAPSPIKASDDVLKNIKSSHLDTSEPPRDSELTMNLQAPSSPILMPPERPTQSIDELVASQLSHESTHSNISATAEDQMFLMNCASDILRIDPNDSTYGAAWDQLARQPETTRHTATQWRLIWEQLVKPKLVGIMSAFNENNTRIHSPAPHIPAEAPASSVSNAQSQADIPVQSENVHDDEPDRSSLLKIPTHRKRSASNVVEEPSGKSPSEKRLRVSEESRENQRTGVDPGAATPTMSTYAAVENKASGATEEFPRRKAMSKASLGSEPVDDGLVERQGAESTQSRLQPKTLSQITRETATLSSRDRLDSNTYDDILESVQFLFDLPPPDNVVEVGTQNTSLMTSGVAHSPPRRQLRSTARMKQQRPQHQTSSGDSYIQTTQPGHTSQLELSSPVRGVRTSLIGSDDSSSVSSRDSQAFVRSAEMDIQSSAANDGLADPGDIISSSVEYDKYYDDDDDDDDGNDAGYDDSDTSNRSTNNNDKELQLEDWIDRKVAAGYSFEQVCCALEATSMNKVPAVKALKHLGKYGQLPQNMRGVWTEQDDRDLFAVDARAIKKVEEKHGKYFFARRMDFLQQ